MNRRQFLMTTAALGGLTPAAAAANEPTDDLDAPEPFRGDISESVAHTASGLTVTENRPRTTEIRVSTHSEAAELYLENEFLTVDAMLLPEDTDSLIERLRAAKAKIDADEAAEARQWVERDHKEGSQ